MASEDGIQVARTLTGKEAGVVLVSSGPVRLSFIDLSIPSGSAWVKIYDKSTTPIAADTPILTTKVNTTLASGRNLARGIQFNNGIGVRVTDNPDDNDVLDNHATVVVNVGYRRIPTA